MKMALVQNTQWSELTDAMKYAIAYDLSLEYGLGNAIRILELTRDEGVQLLELIVAERKKMTRAAELLRDDKVFLPHLATMPGIWPVFERITKREVHAGKAFLISKDLRAYADRLDDWYGICKRWVDIQYTAEEENAIRGLDALGNNTRSQQSSIGTSNQDRLSQPTFNAAIAQLSMHQQVNFEAFRRVNTPASAIYPPPLNYPASAQPGRILNENTTWQPLGTQGHRPLHSKNYGYAAPRGSRQSIFDKTPWPEKVEIERQGLQTLKHPKNFGYLVAGVPIGGYQAGILDNGKGKAVAAS